MNIELKEFNYDTRTSETVGKVSSYTLAKNLSPVIFAELLQEFLNVGMKDWGEGLFVGRALQNAHRTIQGSVIRFCLGIIAGLSEQEYTDARNETPINSAKRIARMLATGELEVGHII